MVFLVSCGSAPFFEENKTIDENIWRHDRPVKLRVDISDTTSTYDVYFNVRNTKDYEYQNLIVFMKINDPDDMVLVDTTFEYRIAEPNGKWDGEVSEALVMNSWLTFKQFSFEKSGTYTYEIEHAMRDLNLNEITDVGIRLEQN